MGSSILEIWMSVRREFDSPITYNSTAPTHQHHIILGSTLAKARLDTSSPAEAFEGCLHAITRHCSGFGIQIPIVSMHAG